MATEQEELEGRLAQLFAHRASAEIRTQNELLALQFKRLEVARLFYAAEEQQGRDDEAQAEVERTQQIYAGRQAVIDYAKAIDESNDATAYEITLLGKGSQAREILLEQYRVEIDRRKQILAIDKNSGYNEEQRVEERIKANEAAARATAGVAGRVQVDEFKKSVDQIDDVFRKGFADMVNGGEGTWKAFTKSLTTTFKTTVADQIYKMFLQPFVVNIVANMMGLTGALGGAGTGSSARCTNGSGHGPASQHAEQPVDQRLQVLRHRFQVVSPACSAVAAGPTTVLTESQTVDLGRHICRFLRGVSDAAAEDLAAVSRRRSARGWRLMPRGPR